MPEPLKIKDDEEGTVTTISSDSLSCRSDFVRIEQSGDTFAEQSVAIYPEEVGPIRDWLTRWLAEQEGKSNGT